MADNSTVEPGQTLGKILSSGASWLESKGVSEPRLVLEWLASFLLRTPRTELKESTLLPDDILSAMRQGLIRLGNGEPIQYVIGEWDFRALTLKTDKRALIPRPETEQLVELVLTKSELFSGTPTIYDVGTGTGAIALSLAYERPNSKIVAIDIEEKALSLAKENAVLCNLDKKVEFKLGRNLCEAAPASIDAIVSNPPYIASKVVDGLPKLIRDFEPRSALDGGEDGLDILRSLIHDSAIALKKGGYIFLEIGDEQGNEVQRLLDDAGFSAIQVYTDFTGKVRFAVGRIE